MPSPPFTFLTFHRYDNRDNKLHLNTIPIPVPKPYDLLVRVACASLCHSDVMLFEPNDQGLVLGPEVHTIGHEASGTVVGLGEEVRKMGFKEGDHVGFLPAIECCYECVPCRTT
jgi:propanol-preferring alcohol dehydrogenase